MQGSTYPYVSSVTLIHLGLAFSIKSYSVIHVVCIHEINSCAFHYLLQGLEDCSQLCQQFLCKEYMSGDMQTVAL